MEDSAGWSSSVARWAHNPEVTGSNPVPATGYSFGRAVACLGLHGRAVLNPEIRAADNSRQTMRVCPGSTFPHYLVLHRNGYRRTTRHGVGVVAASKLDPTASSESLPCVTDEH